MSRKILDNILQTLETITLFCGYDLEVQPFKYTIKDIEQYYNFSLLKYVSF